MAFQIEPAAPIGAEILRLIRDRIKDAIDVAVNRRLPIKERVHTARTSCKRIRAALLLIREHLPKHCRRENAWFRDAADDLAGLRDAEMMLATFEQLIRDGRKKLGPARAQPIRKLLRAHRRLSVPPPAEAERCLATSARRMREARRRLAKLAVPDGEFDIVAAGFRHTYRRARRAMAAAYDRGRPEDFHEWRKAAKAHGYHCDLLRCAWPAVMKTWRSQLAELGDLLGHEHDLVVLDDFLREHAGRETALVRRVIAARRADFQAAAKPLGRHLFAEKPGTVTRHFAAWWAAVAG